MSEPVKRSTDCQSSQEQQKKVVLSESTMNELQLNLPFIEDFEGESSSKSVTSNHSPKKRRVSTDTTYFSSKLTDSLSSLKISKSGDDVDNSSSDKKLKEVEIFTRPLLSFNSIVHESCIDCEHNNVLARHESSKSLKICRICHGGEGKGDLLSPCNCRGSTALTHIECLERRLKKSTKSHCKRCGYRYTIVREPKYGIFKSIFVFILHPDDYDDFLSCLLPEIAFFIMCMCATATVLSTYTLSILSTSATRTTTIFDVLEFSYVLGIVLFACGLTSSFLDTLKQHVLAWRAWYRTNCDLKVILSKSKQPVRYEVEDSDHKVVVRLISAHIMCMNWFINSIDALGGIEISQIFNSFWGCINMLMITFIMVAETMNHYENKVCN